MNAVANAGGGTVTVPGGIFLCQNQIAINIPAGVSLTLSGAGVDATEVHFVNGSGFAFNFGDRFSSIHFEDLAITTSQQNAGVAVYLNDPQPNGDPANTAQSSFINVAVRGHGVLNRAAYVVDISGFWAYGYLVNNVSNINWFGGILAGAVNGTVNGVGAGQGTGIQVQGLSLNSYGVAYNLSGVTFNYLGIGFVYANFVQGVTMSQCNFTGCVTGVYTPQNQGDGLYGLNITVSQFGCSATGVFLQTQIGSFSFVGNIVVLGQNAIGLNIGSSSFAITGNQINGVKTDFSNNDQAVVLLSGGNGVISGNSFNSLTTAIGVASSAAEAGSVIVQTNIHNNVANYIASPTASFVRRNDQY